MLHITAVWALRVGVADVIMESKWASWTGIVDFAEGVWPLCCLGGGP